MKKFDAVITVILKPPKRLENALRKPRRPRCINDVGRVPVVEIGIRVRLIPDQEFIERDLPKGWIQPEVFIFGLEIMLPFPGAMDQYRKRTDFGLDLIENRFATALRNEELRSRILDLVSEETPLVGEIDGAENSPNLPESKHGKDRDQRIE